MASFFLLLRKKYAFYLEAIEKYPIFAA